MAVTFMKPPAIGYIRVSTDAQADHGVSLEVQRERLTAYAALHELDLVEVVADEGVSASIPASAARTSKSARSISSRKRRSDARMARESSTINMR